MKGYFDYVVPPLEGFGWQDGISGTDYTHKEDFIWISVIRLPDFVTKADFDWAVEETAKKMKQDFSKVEFLSYDEGLCVQCMHAGSYDDEPATVQIMHEYMEAQGYDLDITDQRLHHEIYLIGLPFKLILNYISLRNISSNCAKLAGRGLPGAHASAAADSQRKGRSSSLSFSNLVGMPTSTDSWRTASTAALR